VQLAQQSMAKIKKLWDLSPSTDRCFKI
jgi:hypothetical protein